MAWRVNNSSPGQVGRWVRARVSDKPQEAFGASSYGASADPAAILWWLRSKAPSEISLPYVWDKSLSMRMVPLDVDLSQTSIAGSHLSVGWIAERTILAIEQAHWDTEPETWHNHFNTLQGYYVMIGVPPGKRYSGLRGTSGVHGEYDGRRVDFMELETFI
jgi:hypothetical protein